MPSWRRTKKSPAAGGRRYASLVIGDECGNRVFRDCDWEWLADRGVAVIDRFCEAGQRHNGMTEEARTSFLPSAASTAENGSPPF